MHEILFNNLNVQYLNVLTFSDSIFFRNAAIMDHLMSNEEYFLLLIFWYLKMFIVYQFLCLFQWLYMLVLGRSYQEVNHSERFSKLYRIGRTSEGSYKSEEIRLMKKGIVNGICEGIQNAFSYFLIE